MSNNPFAVFEGSDDEDDKPTVVKTQAANKPKHSTPESRQPTPKREPSRSSRRRTRREPLRSLGPLPLRSPCPTPTRKATSTDTWREKEEMRGTRSSGSRRKLPVVTIMIVDQELAESNCVLM